MIVDKDNKPNGSGSKLVAYVSKSNREFRNFLKSKGKKGTLYKRVSKIEDLQGLTIDSYELGPTAKGFFGVSKDVLYLLDLRVKPKGTDLERATQYLEKYQSFIATYPDGSNKEFTCEEWAVFETGIRKICSGINAVKLPEKK